MDNAWDSPLFEEPLGLDSSRDCEQSTQSIEMDNVPLGEELLGVPPSHSSSVLSDDVMEPVSSSEGYAILVAPSVSPMRLDEPVVGKSQSVVAPMGEKSQCGVQPTEPAVDSALLRQRWTSKRPSSAMESLCPIANLTNKTTGTGAGTSTPVRPSTISAPVIGQTPLSLAAVSSKVAPTKTTPARKPTDSRNQPEKSDSRRRAQGPSGDGTGIVRNDSSNSNWKSVTNGSQKKDPTSSEPHKTPLGVSWNIGNEGSAGKADQSDNHDDGSELDSESASDSEEIVDVNMNVDDDSGEDDTEFDMAFYQEQLKLFKREHGPRKRGLRSTPAPGCNEVPRDDVTLKRMVSREKQIRLAYFDRMKEEMRKDLEALQKSTFPVQDSDNDINSAHYGRAEDMESLSETSTRSHKFPENFPFSGPASSGMSQREGVDKSKAPSRGVTSQADARESSDPLRARLSTQKPANLSFDGPRSVKRQRAEFEDNYVGEEVIGDDGRRTKYVHMTNAISSTAPILRSLDGASWKIFNTAWSEYYATGGRNRLFSSMDPSLHIQLCSWLFFHKFINRVSLTTTELAEFFRDQEDIMPILQECCTGKRLPKAKSVVQKEYALPYCYPLDIGSENPQPKWAMKIFKEKVAFHRSHEWAALTQLEGLKQCYPDMKARLEARYKSPNPNWENINGYITADIQRFMSDIFYMKALLWSEYRPELAQTAPTREQGIPSLTQMMALSATKPGHLAATHTPAYPKSPAAPVDPKKKIEEQRGNSFKNRQNNHNNTRNQAAPGQPRDTPPAGLPPKADDHGKYGPPKPRTYTKEQNDAYEKRRKENMQKNNQQGKKY